jgi:hypothetical protein
MTGMPWRWGSQVCQVGLRQARNWQCYGGSKSTSTSLRVMTFDKFVPQDTRLHLSSDRLEVNEDAADHETMVSSVLRKCRWFLTTRELHKQLPVRFVFAFSCCTFPAQRNPAISWTSDHTTYKSDRTHKNAWCLTEVGSRWNLT